MTVRDLMRKLIDLDPDMPVGINAHSSGCDTEHITVSVMKGSANRVDWSKAKAQRPRPFVDRDFAFSQEGDAIVVISR